MSQNSSSNPIKVDDPAPRRQRRWWMILALPLWIIASFYIAQLIVVGILLAAKALGASSLATANDTVLNAILAAIIYSLTILIVVGVPYVVRRSKVSWNVLGMTRWPSWIDIALAPAGLFVYLIISAVLLVVMSMVLPFIDLNQAQDTGFNNIFLRYEYILAFVTLVIIAPIAEELLFRGYLYGQLKRFVPIWVAVVASSLVFGFIHGSWNVGIDTFALGLVLCILREISGSIWPSILLHMTKNGIAFYFLFINPLFLHTLGG